MKNTTTSDDDDGGIPTVVQRALGMQNLTTHQNNCNIDGASIVNNNNVVYGLEAFLLPRYLALRTDSCNVHQLNSSSYDMLMRAKNEELHIVLVVISKSRKLIHLKLKVRAAGQGNEREKQIIVVVYLMITILIKLTPQ